MTTVDVQNISANGAAGVAASTPTTDGAIAGVTLVEAARTLAPRVQALGDEIECERRLPVTLVGEMAAAGLFRMAVPRSYGGPEADPLTMARVVEELAAADGSAAWCVMIAAQTAAMSGYLSADTARTIFADVDTIVAGVARPIGRAVVVRGGYRVSGRWPFASGSSHATWFCGEAVVHDGATPRLNDDGNPLVRLLFFPRDACTVHDTWDTTGLRGTASNDFSVEDVFVPEAFAFTIHVDAPVHPGPLFRALPLLFLGHGSHALGVARAAIAHVAGLARVKPAGTAPGLLGDQPGMQAKIAEARALVESAGCYLYAAGAELWQAALTGGEGTPEQRAAVRLATSHAARSAVQAVDLMYAAAGTSAISARGPLDRQFRDVHTAAAHVMVGTATYEAAGRVALGRPAAMPFF